MSRDLLEKILKNKIECNLQELIDFLILFKKGGYISPSVLKRKFDISDKEVYQILSILEKEKLVKMLYLVICGNCNRQIEMLEHYSDLQEHYYCEDCEDEINMLYNVKIIYKVEI